MNIVKEQARVLKQTRIAAGIYDMLLSFPEGAKKAVPGQFVAMYCNEGSRLLPRPISICEINKDEGSLRVVYRVAGAGTEEFSRMKAGDHLELMGPLGNGFISPELMENPALSPEDQENHNSKKKSILIGGGIGIPPMLALAESLPGEKTVVLGYRDELFLLEDFEKLEGVSMVAVATEDGSRGTKGTVLDAIASQGIEGDIIYACGPLPMLKAIAEYADAKGMEARISLEERMACGIGACLGCVCKSDKKDSHTNVNNMRVCKDGPVFDAREVKFS